MAKTSRQLAASRPENLIQSELAIFESFQKPTPTIRTPTDINQKKKNRNLIQRISIKDNIQSAQRTVEASAHTPRSTNLIAFQSIGSTPGRPVLPPVGRLFNENPLKIKNFSEFLKKQSDNNEMSKTIDME